MVFTTQKCTAKNIRFTLNTNNMRKFTLSDVDNKSSHPHIWAQPDELVEKPLWYHKRGLMQTRSGYGRKLTTDKMIHFNGRLRRIYCCVSGNSGSCYIIQDGKWIFIN